MPDQAQQSAALHARAAEEARAELEAVRLRTGASIRAASEQARELEALRLQLRAAPDVAPALRAGSQGPHADLSHVNDVAGLKARIDELRAQLAAEQRTSTEAGWHTSRCVVSSKLLCVACIVLGHAA